MAILEAKDNIYWVGALDKDLRTFDVIMRTEFGTTYNSYLVRGKEKTVLFETVKDAFFEEHLARIQEICDPSEIDYIVLNHTEPDHSGGILRLLELSPKAKVVASKVALGYLGEILNQPVPSMAVTEKDTIDLGGMTLHFLSVPLLHWPDSMYTYIPEAKALFTCDSFGSHYADDRVFNDLMPDVNFDEAYRYYFDNIMAPFANPHVFNALKKIEPLDVEIICNGHGPVLRTDLSRYVNLYREWSTPVQKEHPDVAIVYVSSYGYTEKMAEKIAEGIRAAGISEVECLDLEVIGQDAAKEKISQASGFLLGSPTMVGDALTPVWQVLTAINPIIHKGKFAGAFGSYAWGGEGVPNLIERMGQLNLKLPMEGLRIKLNPSEEQLRQAFAYGEGFANALLGK